MPQTEATGAEYGFDPTHGYDLPALLQVGAPDEPADYEAFWSERYRSTLDLNPQAGIQDTGKDRRGRRVFDLTYHSTDGVQIGGWVTLPTSGIIRRGFVVMHGYGGRDGPDLHLPFDDSVIFFPCARGLSRSLHPPISTESWWHVRHDLDKPHQYIHRGCVEDVWLAYSAMLRLFPQVKGHLGYLGISFGAGIGAMAMAWEERVARAHLNLPSFGNHPLRLRLPSTGSAASVQEFHRQHRAITERTLSYYDAATAARRIRMPVHFACALYDPMVAPAGQFAVFNSVSGEKQLFQLTAGHHGYRQAAHEQLQLLKEIKQFFAPL